MIDPREFPVDGILIEWNTRKQQFSLNPVHMGTADLPINRPEVEAVWACQSQKVAEWITRFIDAWMSENDGPLRGPSMDAQKMHLLIKTILHADADPQHLSEKEQGHYSLPTFGSVIGYAKQMIIDRGRQPVLGDPVAVQKSENGFAVEAYDGTQCVYAVVTLGDAAGGVKLKSQS